MDRTGRVPPAAVSGQAVKRLLALWLLACAALVVALWRRGERKWVKYHDWLRERAIEAWTEGDDGVEVAAWPNWR
jgi:hypothetical protein